MPVARRETSNYRARPVAMENMPHNEYSLFPVSVCYSASKIQIYDVSLEYC